MSVLHFTARVKVEGAIPKRRHRGGGAYLPLVGQPIGGNTTKSVMHGKCVAVKVKVKVKVELYSALS